MTKDELKAIKKTTEKLLELLGIEAKAEVSENKENEAIKVQIETPDPGTLIGFHGQSLNALQLVLGLIVNKKLGEWQRVIINIGDYREKRAEQLEILALNTAQKVKFSGQPSWIPNLSSFERRLVHLTLANHPDVVTESEGEGNYRRLIVKPRSK